MIHITNEMINGGGKLFTLCYHSETRLRELIAVGFILLLCQPHPHCAKCCQTEGNII